MAAGKPACALSESSSMVQAFQHHCLVRGDLTSVNVGPHCTRRYDRAPPEGGYGGASGGYGGGYSRYAADEQQPDASMNY